MGHLFGNASHKPTSFETTIWAVKVVLITVGVVSSVILVKISVVPSVSSFLVSTLPCMWSFLRSFFSPPYIYIILNFIILIIAASSTFQHQSHHLKKLRRTKTVYRIAEAHADDQLETQDREETRKLTIHAEAELEKHLVEPLKEVGSHLSRFDSALLGRPNAISRESSAEMKEMIVKPPEPRNPGKPEQPGEPEGTLESIWKSIMESQEKPPTPQFMKCSNWDSPPQVDQDMPGPEPHPEPGQGFDGPAFKEDTASLKLGKLLSQDELNRRAEAFIKKFNLDMRLQREESD